MQKYLFLLFILASVNLFAQGGNRYAAKRVFEFRKSTTIVILDELERGRETDYNIALKKAIETYWKITPTVFKRQSELAGILPMPGFSLLVKSTRLVANADGYTVQKHSDLAIFMADKDSLNFYGGVDEISSVEIFDTQDPAEITCKLPLILMAMQQYANFIAADGGIDTHNFYDATARFFNKNKKDIHKDTLYVCQEDLPSDLTPEAFGKAYKHAYKFISRSDLPALIEKKEKGYVLHLDMAYKQMWVLRISDGTICYQGTPQEKGKLLAKDIGKL